MTNYKNQEERDADIKRLKTSNYPQMNMKLISFSLTPNLFDKINHIVSEGDYVSRSGFIRECVRVYIGNMEKGE